MSGQLENAISKYLHSDKFSIKKISEEKRGEYGAFLIKYRNKKLKAIVFEDEIELKNFLAFSPLIKKSPKILYNNKNIVLTEWLEGKTIKSEHISLIDLKKIAKLQASIHNIKVKFNKRKIIKRFNKKIYLYLYKLDKMSDLTSYEIKKIKYKFKNEFPKNPRISLVHHDWIVDNLLKTKKGWYTVDNEVFSVYLTGFDLGKPLNSLCKTDKQREVYLRAYSSIIPTEFYTKHKDFYQLAFLIKTLYARLRDNLSADKTYANLRELIKH